MTQLQRLVQDVPDGLDPVAFKGNVGHFPIAPELGFHGVPLHGLGPDDDPQGAADQVRILELHPGPFVPVIQQGIDAGLVQASWISTAFCQLSSSFTFMASTITW